MFEILIIAGLLIAILLIVLLLMRGAGGNNLAALTARLDAIDLRLGDSIGIVKLSVDGLRDEIGRSSVSMRAEISSNIDRLANSLQASVHDIGKQQSARLDSLIKGLADAQDLASNQGKNLREELLGNFDKLSGTLTVRMVDHSAEQTRRLDSFSTLLGEHRAAALEDAKALRDEVVKSLTALGKSIADNLDIVGKQQRTALETTTIALKDVGDANERRQEALRVTVESKLDGLRTENSEKLEQMRATVDEKLQGTLNERLGASFSQVNENLERVFKSVGEMQALATGVGDLKRVLSNIKMRGTWGEGSLGTLLEQVLTPEQFAVNVEIKPHSNQRVEYAIRLPGDGDVPLWIPIDSKMPLEDYERLARASEAADAIGVEDAAKSLERSILKCGQDISSKYVHPPHSTDFAVMFLPSEGLFAEVVRRPGLLDRLQRESRIIVTGPTTLMALLNSLRMGFRSLAIQERSSEVWQVLASVKSEFGKFGPVLEKIGKKLGEAQNVVSEAQKRGRAMDRQLRQVESIQLPGAPEIMAIALPTLVDEDDDEDAPVETLV